MYDAIIVGGGPAGLSAALVLGRCRRRVLVCDDGHPRNAASHGLHGFISRDGIEPAELLRVAREQLRPYAVEFRQENVTAACKIEERFEVTLRHGEKLSSKKLLLATGVVDKIPKLDGIDGLYGRSVFHCPYCDGWEMRDQPLAVYGSGKNGAGLAVSLKTWSGDIVLCTDGPTRLRRQEAERLSRHGIPVRNARISRLEGNDGVLEQIVFADGTSLARRGIFFSTGQEQGCGLPAQFGCLFTSKGAVRTNTLEGTNIPGLYVAGDASKDVQLVIVAAAEGAKAAFAINRSLEEEERA
jgi:thioredoxin reductase